MSDATVDVDQFPGPPADDAAEAVREAADLLWPAPATVTVGPRGSTPPGHHVVAEHLLLPSASRPRLLVPAGAPRAAAAAARRRGSTSLRGALAAHGLAIGLRSGLLDRVHKDRLLVTATPDARAETVEDVLAGLLGRRALVSLTVGTARVNRKPVLHVLSTEGATLAYVKVGHTEAAKALVRQEAANLRLLAGHELHLLEIPRVLHLQAWQDLDLLVLSAVGEARRRDQRGRVPYAAMRELASVGGSAVALAGSPYVQGLLDVSGRLHDAALADRFGTAMRRLTTVAGDAVLRFGAWHGDWTPWNMTWLERSDERVALWDWERFNPHAPVGFDAAHFRLQELLLQHGVGTTVEQAFFAAAERVLSDGGADRDTAPLVVALYAAELAARYLILVQEPGGAPLSRRAAWVPGFLEAAVARL